MKKIIFENIEIELLQKRMKYLRIRILAPDGRVRVSAPSRVSLKIINEFLAQKISWIKEKQIQVRSRKLPPVLQYISDEEHYFFGKKYKLEITEHGSALKASLHENIIKLRVRKNSTREQKIKILDNFYRAELKKIIPQHIKELEKKMKVEVKEFGIKKMKTRWGTCNPRAKRIWINLELAKKPSQCLEYIVVHEMVHLLERKHNKRFHALMDVFMPNWREHKTTLNRGISMSED